MAEEVRPEMSGKSTVLGLFPDDVIVMQGNRPEDAPAELPDGLERLSFFINVSDIAEGHHSFKGNITDPSGAPYNSVSPLGEETIKKGLSRSIIVEIKPFIIKGKGIYHFNLYVDDLLTTHPFEIR